MKITCQHCAIHHLFTAEEILALAKSLHVRACERLDLDPLVLDWSKLATAEQNCFIDYATAMLEKLGEFLHPIEPPLDFTLAQEVAHLRNFKSYVHERLDGMGVAKDPVPGDSCRIGKRLDIVAHTLHRMEGLDK